MPDFSAVHHLALTVSDLERSERWYCDVLGMSKLVDMPESDAHKIALLVHPGSQLLIGLHWHASNEGGPFSEFRNGLDHVGFAVADRAALEEWKARLDELGVDNSGITDAPYGCVLVFRDPDNIQLEFFSMPAG